MICTKLNSSDWLSLINSSLVILSIFAAFLIYFKSRKDNAKDSFDFFLNSAEELPQIIESATKELKKFSATLISENQDFTNPILPSGLSSNFLDKINLIDLSRYNKKNKSEEFKVNFNQFLKDYDFLISYNDNFINELNLFRNYYQSKENEIKEWQLLTINLLYSNLNSKSPDSFKKFHNDWVLNLKKDKTVILDNVLVNKMELMFRISDFIKGFITDKENHIMDNELANTISLKANKVYSAYIDSFAYCKALSDFINKDIVKFENIIENLNFLLKK